MHNENWRNFKVEKGAYRQVNGHHSMMSQYLCIYMTNRVDRSHRVVGECLQENRHLLLPINHVQTLWCYIDVC